ncbi:MAG: alpha-amylase family glycosyl hydrolase [Ignavibacteriaceae bacterium]|jgi:glycosidase|nr:alpha-amylase family glycosyl hydrolase [Ignavibacteriaceae bacterium]
MKLFAPIIFFISFCAFTHAQTTYWWNDAVFYEIFVRSYYDSDGNGIGDFKGLTQKLDYLNDGNDSTTSDLGVTAIWLMPITESPSYHGYSVVDYKKIEQDYGTNQDFKNFLDSAHTRGIKVIIDLVLNHTSNQHPWFIDAQTSPNATHRNWYRWSSTNPNITGPLGNKVWYSANGYYYYGLFNSGMPDLNYFNQEVKNEVANIVTYWLDTVKVDGFRLDAIKYLCEEGNVMEDAPSTFAYLKEFRALTKSINPNAMSVGEVWSTTSKVSPYATGAGMDFCFEFEIAGNIIGAINSGSPATLINEMKTVIQQSYPFLQYGTFLTNHDQQRVFSQLRNNLSKAKLAASVLLTLPGVPFIYYGEEIGMTSANDDPSKRTPMQWTSGTNAGFTTGTPWKNIPATYVDYNIEKMSTDTLSLLNWYKKLIRIRLNHPVLTKGKYYYLISANNSIYAFARNLNSSSEIIIPIHNFSGSVISNPNFYRNDFTGLAVGTYKLTDLITNNDAGQLTIASNGAINCTPNISIPAYGSVILKADKLTGINDYKQFTTFKLEQNYPNPFNPVTNINFELPSSGLVKLSVYNLLGEEIKTLINGFMEEGMHNVKFDAKDLNSGVYLYKLQSGGYTQTRKMIVIR